MPTLGRDFAGTVASVAIMVIGRLAFVANYDKAVAAALLAYGRFTAHFGARLRTAKLVFAF